MEKEYFLGLDLGTNSVGWAVTDRNYKLIKYKGKDMWGIREFEEAATSVERRIKRISRRRRQRQKARMGMLYCYFHDAISEVDPDFYQRLKNSKYHLEDKDENVRYKYGLFHDVDFTDVDYYKQYPTIFHLRKELIENPNPHDVRLVFLAVLNMFKRRGHFLAEGLNAEAATDLKNCYLSVNEKLEVLYDDKMLPEQMDDENVRKILADSNLSRSQKTEKLIELLVIDKKDKVRLNVIKGICGLSVKIKDLFLDEEFEKSDVTIKFSEASYVDKEGEIAELLGETRYSLIEAMKSFYDASVLLGILGGSVNNYLSFARVEQYEKHKMDLQLLKDVIRLYGTNEEYDEMFRSEKDATYSAYVGSCNSEGVSRELLKYRRGFDSKKRNRDEFYKSIKKMLEKYKKSGIDDKRIDDILDEIGKESFLPKQLTGDNGVIPNQIHAGELKKILENASVYLPFLNEKDESGLMVRERIQQLFEFHIPYYLGPLSEQSELNRGNGWVVRKESGKVFPWNLNEKVDVGETSVGFIERLIRKCTYLYDEKVLPKNALIYEKFCVLNEINNIRINNERINPALKKDIFKELFCKGKKVTRKQIVDYLISRGRLKDQMELSGIDISVKQSLSSYGKFLAIFGEKLELEQYQIIAEDIIRDVTIYGDSKKRLKEVLVKKYQQDRSVLTDQQIKRILGYRFRDWGRLSKEFLELQGCNKETGEACTIISAMMEDQLNLMELLHSEQYTFHEVLQERVNSQTKLLSEFEFEDLKDYYFSAPVKRMVWQTILLIREIEKIIGEAPKRVFIEMTRTDGVKGDRGRKDSRAKQLTELYKNIKDETRNWSELINAENESGRIKSKKMYLYLTQMGKSMYTGIPIDLEDLFDDNKYDIDHIYPRHFVKDDNLSNNLVLVEKNINNRKQDEYPLSSEIRNDPEVCHLWKYLREKKLINEEKYKRLTCSQPFSDEQLSDFIARQMVETSQATKGVADLLKNLLPETTEIVYSKASNVSEFRRNGLMDQKDEDGFLFPKSRVLNDFHHAQDAYLNIVVGNTYYVKFTKNPKNFIKNEFRMDHQKYAYTFRNFLKNNIVRNGEKAWVAQPDVGEEKSIEIVKRMMRRNTPILTRMSLTGHGGLANETLYSRKKASRENYVPLKANDPKMSDVTKYGGFTSISVAYLFLVEHTQKKKRIRTLETMPIMMASQVKNDKESMEAYCRETLHLVDPDVRITKINMHSFFKINGYFVHITGKTNKQFNLKNSVQMCLEKPWVSYLKLIENYLEKDSNHMEQISKEKNVELYNIILNKHCNGIYAKKPNPMGKTIEKGVEAFQKMDIVSQCQCILQLCMLTSVSSGKADLKSIGGSTSSGVMLIGKEVSSKDEFIWINQSVTGLFENSIDLKTV